MEAMARGTLIDGQFEVVRSLGRGGMGSVYLATYLGNCPVALKLVGDPPPGTSIAEFDLRFIRECRIMMGLRHPAIVSAYTHGITVEGLRYLVMEYVPGQTLDVVRSRNGGPLSPSACAELLVPLADALAYCHQRAIAHRDLSPQNVLCASAAGGDRLHAKLVDFGAGWRSDARQLTTEVVFANVDFQPLERFTMSAREDPLGVGIRSDVYALGALAYFLTGGDGRSGEVLTIEQKAGQAPLAFSGDPRWSDLLERALDPDESRRIASMPALLTNLRALLESPRIPPIPFWEREDDVRETSRPVQRSEGASPPPDAAPQPPRPYVTVSMACAVVAALALIAVMIAMILR